MEQGIDQRSGPVSRCRMHDDARRFVEDQQVLVFKKYFQRNRLALQLEWLRLRDIHRDLIARLDLLAGPDDLVIDPNASEFDEPLEP